VVCAAFDSRLDDAVLRLVPGGRPRHRPHLTLGSARVDAAGVTDVVDVAAAVAGASPGVPVRLDSVGVFPRGGVLWLAPAPTAALRALQAAVDAALTRRWPRAFGERSSPPAWVAHCTLARRLRPEEAGAGVAAACARLPLRGGYVAALSVLLVGGRGDVALLPLQGLPPGAAARAWPAG
jgi:2'-5' RNA ligase